MKKSVLIILFIAIIIAVLLVGCGGNKIPADTTDTIDAVKTPEIQVQEELITYNLVEAGEIDHIIIDGQTFDLDYINTVLTEAINNELYFYDNEDALYLFSNSKLLLGKSIEYDLYYVHYTRALDREHMIYAVFPNETYPLRDDEVYELGYPVTTKGMSHEVYSMRPVLYDPDYGNSDKATYQFLGKFNMKINGISKPQYDEISDNQRKAIDSGVKEWMEIDSSILEPGTYEVYVRGFYQADSSANIFFIHENGNLYSGYLWSGNGFISESDEPTIPYRVGRYEESAGSYEEYMELIKENSVFYGIYEKTGDGSTSSGITAE